VTNWNYADVLEVVAATQPDAIAVRQGAREVTYAAFARHAGALGASLRARGAGLQDKVALYLYNSPEYLEATFAAFSARLVPVNTNYRYGDDELAYLWDNGDCVALVFHGTFTDRVERLRARCPRITTFVHVDDATTPCPAWAEPYDALAGAGSPAPDEPRSGDDLLLLYTGGTTGMPKGVMWRQDDLFCRLNGGGFRRYELDGGFADVAAQVAAEGPGVVALPACPLMHGTGLFSALELLAEGGTAVLLESRHFSGDELLDTIERHGVWALSIVGDPFARPMLEALRARRDGTAIASLVVVVSSGAMFSEEIKEGLLAFNSGLLLVDTFGSSEAIGLGRSLVASSTTGKTAEFDPGADVRLIAEDGGEVAAGSGVPGLIALRGRLPLGYYKDDVKTAATFRMIDGERYSVPGDWALRNGDGTLTLLGRGSQCINTAGEKVFPEEVEEVLKTHAHVRDACVLGVPDEKWGEVVMAVVEPVDGASPDEVALIDHVKGHLAHYKAPRRVRVVASIGRAPSGKMDYARHRDEMAAWLAAAG